jgi:hypothetical protein
LSLARPAIVVAITAACGLAMAEMVDQARSAAKTKPTPVESMARIPDDTARSVLRCWQEGRLVFEGSGIGAGEAASSTSSRTFKGANGRTVQLLDLRQGLCILERSNG